MLRGFAVFVLLQCCVPWGLDQAAVQPESSMNPIIPSAAETAMYATIPAAAIGLRSVSRAPENEVNKSVVGLVSTVLPTVSTIPASLGVAVTLSRQPDIPAVVTATPTVGTSGHSTYREIWNLLMDMLNTSKEILTLIRVASSLLAKSTSLASQFPEPSATNIRTAMQEGTKSLASVQAMVNSVVRLHGEIKKALLPDATSKILMDAARRQNEITRAVANASNFVYPAYEVIGASLPDTPPSSPETQQTIAVTVQTMSHMSNTLLALLELSQEIEDKLL